MKQYPDLRFGQILQAFDFVKHKQIEENVRADYQDNINIWENEFYTEPDVILERVKKALGK